MMPSAMTDPSAASGPLTAPPDDLRLVAALRLGDEAAFGQLVDQYYGAMRRLAVVYVGDYAVAEEVVQETWLGVLNGLARFEGRSSLKTWVFRILTNIAKTRSQREGRSLPFSAFAFADEDDEPAVDADRFQGPDGRYPGHWASAPDSWGDLDEHIFSQQTRAMIDKAIQTLPPAQRQVITLRDIEGWSSDEVCNVLGLSETNQRVLLHRARSKVRRALETYLHSD